MDSLIYREDFIDEKVWSAALECRELRGTEPPFSRAQLDRVQSLAIVGAHGLGDLRLFKGLERLTIQRCTFDDLTPVECLNGLKDLSIVGCEISDADMKRLSGLVGLRRLEMTGCNVSAIAPLAKLINLTELALDSNNITDVSPLAELSGLEALSLMANPLRSVAPLRQLKNLKQLHVDLDKVSDAETITDSPLADVINIDMYPPEYYKSLETND